VGAAEGKENKERGGCIMAVVGMDSPVGRREFSLS